MTPVRPDRSQEALPVLRKLALALIFVTLGVATALAADLNGKWTGTLQTPTGTQYFTFDFKADGHTLTGKVTGPHGKFDIQEGKIDGQNISFYQMVPFQDYDVKVDFNGKVQGDSIKFVRNIGPGNAVEFTATRAK